MELDQARGILVQQVSAGPQLVAGQRELADVLVERTVTLVDRHSRIARSFAVGLRHRERNVRAGQADELPFGTDISLAQVPAGVRGHGDRDFGRKQTSKFVAVGSTARGQDFVIAAKPGRLPIDDVFRLPARAEVQPTRLLDDLGIIHAGNVGEAGSRVTPIDQRVVADLGIDAQRRRGAVLRPAVQGEQQDSQERLVVAGIGQRLPVPLRQWPAARAVLGSAERVEADSLGNVGIANTQRVGVRQRTAASPVLGRRLGVHHQRRGLGLGGPAQDAVGLSRQRVGLSLIGERKPVRRVVVMIVLIRMPRGLREAMIERAQSATGDMRDQPVKGWPPSFVLVESGIEKLAQESPALRDAESMCPADERLTILHERIPFAGPRLDRGDQIADGGEADPHHQRIGRFVDQLVDRPGLHAAGHFDFDVRQLSRRVARHIGHMQRPLIARNSDARGGLPRSNRQRRLTLTGLSRSVRTMIGPVHDHPFRAGRRDELAAHLPGDPLVARLGDRGHQPQTIAAGQQFAVPAAPDDREPVTHQEAVAGVFASRRVVVAAIVEHPQRQLVAAVVHVVQQCPVSFRGIRRGEDEQVRPELDPAGIIPRSQRQIDHARILSQTRIEREVDAADDSFIRPRRAKGFPVRKRFTPRDLKPHGLGEHRRSPGNNNQQTKAETGAHLFLQGGDSFTGRIFETTSLDDSPNFWGSSPAMSAVAFEASTGTPTLSGTFRWVVSLESRATRNETSPSIQSRGLFHQVEWRGAEGS